MSYDVENGYSPRDFNDILAEYTQAVNEAVGATYTPESIIGTNWYKYGYAGIQMIMAMENRFAANMARATEFVNYWNNEIINPLTTPDGIVQQIELNAGVKASVMQINQLADAGKVYIACDVDTTAEDYASTKAKIIQTIGKSVTAGAFFNGTETGVFTGLNGQQYNIAYEVPQVINMVVKIVATISRNTTDFVPTENVITNLYRQNFANSYRLGYDFEPDSYICTDQLPWASNVAVTYSANGAAFTEEVFKSAYNQKIVLSEVSAEIVDGSEIQ